MQDPSRPGSRKRPNGEERREESKGELSGKVSGARCAGNMEARPLLWAESWLFRKRKRKVAPSLAAKGLGRVEGGQPGEVGARVCLTSCAIIIVLLASSKLSGRANAASGPSWPPASSREGGKQISERSPALGAESRARETANIGRFAPSKSLEMSGRVSGRQPGKLALP